MADNSSHNSCYTGFPFTSSFHLVPKHQGYSFRQVLALTDLQEGDVISSFRQTIDLLKQLKDVYRHDVTMLKKLNASISLMDRDVVKVVI